MPDINDGLLFPSDIKIDVSFLMRLSAKDGFTFVLLVCASIRFMRSWVYMLESTIINGYLFSADSSSGFFSPMRHDLTMGVKPPKKNVVMMTSPRIVDCTTSTSPERSSSEAVKFPKNWSVRFVERPKAIAPLM